jgi:type II secretory pathway component GspD/PulD (secretin)
VRDVLMLLFRGTPFSIVLDPAAGGTFSGDLKDITLRQALESVLYSAGLDYDANGTVLRVYPRRPQTRFFSVDHLSAPRAGADYFAEIDGGLQTIVSGSGKYHVSRKASLVEVTDFADRLDLVAVYLEAAHLRVNRQVRIQARVLEIERAEAVPTDWARVAARPGSGVRVAPGAAAWRVDDFDAWLRTIEQIGVVRHIGAPVLLAMNNEPASLRADDAASELRLTVTPQIAADRIIHMHVAPGIVDARAITPGGGAGQFTANADTVVRIADGETIFISGLLRRRGAGSHSEVVVFLTATTVTLAGS